MKFSQKTKNSRVSTNSDGENSNFEGNNYPNNQNFQVLIPQSISPINNFPNEFEMERIQYEKKIREQGQSLYEMHQYIMLCEERIKQLCPEHELPVTEKHITAPVEGLKMQILKKENDTLRSSNMMKDKVNLNLLIIF